MQRTVRAEVIIQMFNWEIWGENILADPFWKVTEKLHLFSFYFQLYLDSFQYKLAAMQLPATIYLAKQTENSKCFLKNTQHQEWLHGIKDDENEGNCVIQGAVLTMFQHWGQGPAAPRSEDKHSSTLRRTPRLLLPCRVQHSPPRHSGNVG